MQFRKLLLRPVLCMLLFGIGQKSLYAQVSVTGPTCVVAGSTYNYNVTGTYNGANTMQWCITGSGGTILQAYGNNITGTSTCKSGNYVGSIVVKWTGAGTGSISLSCSPTSPSTLSITVKAVLSPGSISTNKTQTINYNTIPAAISCAVAANGACTPSYSYQWQQSSDNVNWADISGSTAQNLSFTNALLATTYYRRKVTETTTNTIDYSDVATVFVNPPFSYTVISPASQSIFTGSAPAIISGAAATGGSCGGSYTYEWYSSTDGVNFTTKITGAAGVSYTPPALTTTTYYRRKDICGTQSSFSSVSVVNVYQHLSSGAISPSTLKISYNTSPGTISPTSPTGGMCTPNYSYQWQQSTDNVAWTNITGANSLSYNPGALTVTTFFRLAITCASETATTNALTVTVNPQLFSGTIVPSSINIASNTSPGLLAADPASGGGCSGSFTYQWQQSPDNITFTNITGATSQNYTPGNLTATTYYRRKVSCDIDVAYTNSCRVNIGSCGQYNYVQVRQVTKPGITTVTDAAALIDPNDVSQTTQYFDGLGRPLQTVVRQESPLKKDMVSFDAYDDFGREPVKYLPYVSPGSDGKFRCASLSEQISFNTAQFPDEQFYYNRTDFEASPLNTILTTYAPGNNWTGSSRGVSAKQWTNTPTDDVRLWTVTDVTNSFGTYSQTTYGAATLYKTITTDEQGKQVIEFKDMEGKVVLKKVQLTAASDNGSGSSYPGWLSTYYIYDDYGNLRCVIQPRGVELLIANGWDITASGNAILDQQCFRYEYDGRNRMTMKKVPGADPVYMVYDNRDRLVFSQDGNLRIKSQWAYTLYDDVNRQVQTGIMGYADMWYNLQAYVNNAGNLPSTQTTTGTMVDPVIADLVIPQRETGRKVYNATNSIVLDNGFTSEDGALITAEIITGNSNTFTANIAVNTNPVPTTGATLYPLDYIFYDNYDWTGRAYTTANNSQLDDGGNPYADALPGSATLKTTGLVTGKRVRVLEDPNNLASGRWLETASFYDDKVRALQVNSDNYKGGQDISTSRYDFAGKTVSSQVVHNNAAGNSINLLVETSLLYDHAARVLKVTKTIVNGGVTTTRTLAQNSYNELGQLKTKGLGTDPNNAPNPLETLTYDYNIRGWLLGANRDYAKNVSSTSNYFGFDLGYDKTDIKAVSSSSIGSYAAAAYNGNITGMVWKSKGDNQVRKYDFSYDAVNRLLTANFTQYSTTNSTFDVSDKIDFTVNNLSYDANGNIKSMLQKGWKPGGSVTVDDLYYKYSSDNSNKLQNVVDQSNDVTTTLGDFRSSSSYITSLGGTKTVANAASYTDYSYDINGNLTSDKNKNITGIVYNHLNLPWQISVNNDDGSPKGTITYIYDAEGNKLEKRTSENASSTNGNTGRQTLTSYLSGFVYQNNSLQFLGHEEGSIRKKDDGTFVFDYFLKDHLGNVRMMLTEEQKTDVYPTLDFEGTAGTTAVTNQDATWDNSTGGAVDVAGTRTAFNMGNSSTNGTYSKLIKKSSWGGAIGAAKLLKVMSGDQINTSVDYYWPSATVSNSNANGISTLTTSLLSILANTAGVSASIKGAIPTVNGGLTADPNIISRITTPENNTSGSTQPKAYLHVLLFNEQFQFDNVNSVVVQIRSTANVKDNLAQVVNVKKNGYAYIYFSNESDNDVYFDNFKLTDVRGPILEETHYYPFGLAMAGIGSQAASPLGNKYHYNGKEQQNKEFSDNSGLELYDYGARMQDPQIGRWWVVDPMAEKYKPVSPYNYAVNNPVKYIDIDGNIIGNPNDPNVKRLQTDLQKTDKGKKLWNDLVNSTRTVTFVFGSQQADDGSIENKVGWNLATNQAAGKTVSKNGYDKIINESVDKDKKPDDYTFNDKTGFWDKTENWDDTYVLVNLDDINTYAESLKYSDGKSVESSKGFDITLQDIAGEEAEHALQDYGDWTKQVKDPKTGLYIKPTDRKSKKAYNEQQHEREAKMAIRHVLLDYLRINNITLDAESMKLLYNYGD